MPVHAVQQDLDAGRLVKLAIEDMPDEGLSLPMVAIYMTAKPPGPAGRWLIERLRQCSNRGAEISVASTEASGDGATDRP
jgi:DNA-binding transcriptional LysR family regulator